MKSCVPRGAVKFDMNAFFIVCAIAALATVPTWELQAAFAAAASTLFESTPFILAGGFAARLAPRRGITLAALAGCGCASGPGARSLAVAGATALTFGPLVAIARLLAAFGVARWLRRPADLNVQTPALAELSSVLPYALAAGVAASTLRLWLSAHLEPLFGFIAGGTLAMLSPCTLGAVAFAGTLRALSPPAAVAILLIAGICDLRTLRPRPQHGVEHDALAYGIAAVACVILAAARGGTLLNPRFTIALWLCAIALSILGYVHRRARSPRLRWAPLIMAAGTLCTGALPTYAVTETTLADAAPGEMLRFHGVLVREGKQDALVRYSITCCRADAQPVAVRLKSPLHERTGQWFDARGTLIGDQRGLALDVRTYKRTGAPTDPFIYR